MQPLPSEYPELYETLGAVFARHRQRWFRYLIRFLGDPSDAEDVIQESVWKVLARRRSFLSEDELRMYLGRTISNTAVELYHARKRERAAHSPVEAVWCAGSAGGAPDGLMELTEDSRVQEMALGCLRAGLDSLPPKQHEAVRLTYLTPGLGSIREVGAALGIPSSTLRHRAIQGVRRLRRYLSRALRKGGAVNPMPRARRRPSRRIQRSSCAARRGGLPDGPSRAA